MKITCLNCGKIFDTQIIRTKIIPNQVWNGVETIIHSWSGDGNLHLFNMTIRGDKK